jgi:hypothetical protein
LLDGLPYRLDKLVKSSAALKACPIKKISKHPGPQTFADLQLHAHPAPAPIADVTPVLASQTRALIVERLESRLPQAFLDAFPQSEVDSANMNDFSCIGTAMYRDDRLRTMGDFKGVRLVEEGACNMEVFVSSLLHPSKGIE